MASVKLENISLSLGGKKVLDNICLDIQDGEYFSIVGETGAGKTSLLKIICGLLKPDEGRVIVDGKDITRVPAELRNIGMVFEDYALFPHYTTLKNVIYSHRVRDIDREITMKAARAVLNLVLLTGREDAMPGELSGGMQQRVALARSMMTDSGVLLLDDPFSALDAGLRMNLRMELKRLSREIGTTIIHCTNDIEEAMMVGNCMAIMHDGRIEQLGTPADIYHEPINLYVANFLGFANFFKVKVEKVEPDKDYLVVGYPHDGSTAVPEGDHEKDIDGENGDGASNGSPNNGKNGKRLYRIKKRPFYSYKPGDLAVLCVRAEQFHMHEGYRKKPNRMYGTIRNASFLGHLIRYDVVTMLGDRLKVERFVNEKTRHKNYFEGQEITINFHPALGLLFPFPGDDAMEEFQKI